MLKKIPILVLIRLRRHVWGNEELRTTRTTRSATSICRNKWLNADHDRKNILGPGRICVIDSSCKWELLRAITTRRSWACTDVRTNRSSRSERAERSGALRGITTIIRIITPGVSETSRQIKPASIVGRIRIPSVHSIASADIVRIIGNPLLQLLYISIERSMYSYNKR